MLELDQLHTGDTNELIKHIDDKSVQTIITSPPYFGKRDYGTGHWTGGDTACDHSPARTPTRRGIKSSTLQGNKEYTSHQKEGYISKCGRCGAIRQDKQMGLEITPELFLRGQVSLFKQCHRILKDNGTLWVNMGDGNWGGKGRSGQESRASLEKRHKEGKSMNKSYQNTGVEIRAQDRKHPAYKPKDLIGMPWRLAFALQGIITMPAKTMLSWCDRMREGIADRDWENLTALQNEMFMDVYLQCFLDNGWYLRQDIIWYKPNVQPESVKDRPSVTHEHIFLLSKSKKYKYNHEAIMEPVTGNAHPRISRATRALLKQGQLLPVDAAELGSGIKNNSSFVAATSVDVVEMRNKRSVWVINSEPGEGDHSATFPQEIPEICIRAGSDEGDLVYDPYAGTGTTLIVAEKLKRRWLGTELNPKDQITYNQRRRNEFGIFL